MSSIEKVVVTVDKHGNTSAASIPLALSVAVADGRSKKGDRILLEAMGGGFTWGSALLRWERVGGVASLRQAGGFSSQLLMAPLTPSGHANIVDNSAGYLRRGQGGR